MRVRLLATLVFATTAIAACRAPLCIHTISNSCSCHNTTDPDRDELYNCMATVDEVFCTDDALPGATTDGATLVGGANGMVAGFHDPCEVQPCCGLDQPTDLLGWGDAALPQSSGPPIPPRPDASGSDDGGAPDASATVDAASGG